MLKLLYHCVLVKVVITLIKMRNASLAFNLKFTLGKHWLLVFQAPSKMIIKRISVIHDDFITPLSIAKITVDII